jgi:hypothetical protein
MIMKKLLAAAALSLPLVTAGYAAAEPMRLSDDQMDGVNAGAAALAIAAAAGVGNAVLTAAETFADVRVVKSATYETTTINLHQSTSLAAAAVIAH